MHKILKTKIKLLNVCNTITNMGYNIISISQAMKAIQNTIVIITAILPIVFLEGCYYSDYHYDYRGGYAYYNGYACRGVIESARTYDNNKKCDVCVNDWTDPNGVSHHEEHVMYCWDYPTGWDWVWGGLAIFFLVLTIVLCVWCCCVSRRVAKQNQGKIFGDEEAPLVVTGPDGTMTSQYTVEQLKADNQRDLEQQQQLNQRVQERQNAIDALSNQQQQQGQVVASTNQEVIMQGGEVMVSAPPVQGQPPSQ